MVSRSISIASLDYRAKCFFIDHSKFDALPYESYSLHRKNNNQHKQNISKNQFQIRVNLQKIKII